MKSFTPQQIPQVEKFDDPYGFGATFLIRRLGSTKSGNKEVKAFITDLTQRRAKCKREALQRARKMAPKAGVTDWYILMGDDQTYGDELRVIDEEESEKENYHGELNSISVIADWSGSAFKKTELPIDGDFDDDLVREMIFEPHGPLDGDEDEQIIVPRFKHTKSGKTIDNQSSDFNEIESMFDKVDKECIKKGEAEEKRLQIEFNELEFDNKQKFQYEARVVEYRDKIKASYAELREKYEGIMYENLKAMGYEELPFFSYSLRVALALWIAEKSVEVESNYNRKKGVFRRV